MCSAGSAARAVRRDEAIALALEQRLVVGQVERRGEEVLGGGVLLQAPHEVADRDVELVRAHDRHVQQHVADLAGDRGDLTLRHAEEHLELDALASAALVGEQPGVGDVEEVVAGDADPHGGGVVGVQREVQAPQVVGVGVDLGVVGRERPPVHHGIHSLHREVRALHEPHLDARAARRDALLRPRGELLEGGERIGQVGLQHDAGLEARSRGSSRMRVKTAIVRSRSRYSSMSRLMNVGAVAELSKRPLR